MIDKVGNAIIECDYFGVILSKNSVKSEWVKKELQLALQNTKMNGLIYNMQQKMHKTCLVCLKKIDILHR